MGLFKSRRLKPAATHSVVKFPPKEYPLLIFYAFSAFSVVNF